MRDRKSENYYLTAVSVSSTVCDFCYNNSLLGTVSHKVVRKVKHLATEEPEICLRSCWWGKQNFTGAWQNNFDVVVYLLLGLLSYSLCLMAPNGGVKSALIWLIKFVFSRLTSCQRWKKIKRRGYCQYHWFSYLVWLTYTLTVEEGAGIDKGQGLKMVVSMNEVKYKKNKQPPFECYDTFNPVIQSIQVYSWCCN